MLFERVFEEIWMSLQPSLFCKICLQTLLRLNDSKLIVIVIKYAYLFFLKIKSQFCCKVTQIKGIRNSQGGDIHP